MVLAWIPAKDGEKFYTYDFPISSIEGVLGIDEKSSALVLRSGAVITVALPREELKKKVYTHDIGTTEIDLSDVTGEAAKDILTPKPETNPVLPQENKSLTITALLRECSDDKYTKHYSFQEEAIISIEQVGSWSRCKKSLRIKFNTLAKKCPFSHDGAYLDMPKDDYDALVVEAKKNGQAMLDLAQIFKDNPKKYGFN